LKVQIVFAHPNPESFNAAVLDSFRQGLQEAGHQNDVMDLYADKFDPVLTVADFQDLAAGKAASDIAAYQQKVADADALAFICPVWWFGVPAILKGWVDRVLSHGFAFQFQEDGTAKGLLKHKKALVIQTCGGSQEAYEQYGFKAAMQKCIDDGIVRFCGIADVTHEFLYNVVGTTDEVRKGYLDRVRELGKSF